ncbi:MAG: ABC transporter permease subunit [Chitinivibrionales bacterium]|nr:ABC transporter permease subunit [Chitinivibrionales bacterium]MBD3394882.1 ABC transporter permease subunit [Chitinivibrionales bacterium]
MMANANDVAAAKTGAHIEARYSIGHLIVYITLVALALFFLLPFIWQVLTSFKTLLDTERTIWPSVWVPRNYLKVFEQIRFGRYFFNSIFVALWVTTLQVTTSSFAAFAFSRLKWPGRDKVFLLYLATMMIPPVVLMIPNFWIIMRLGLYNSYAGLIVPAAFSAFGTFLLRQFMMTIPSSLDEAATIDGATEWQVFTDIILPLARPGIIVLSIFTFMGNYRSFFWPLILIKDDALRTLPIGLMYFDSVYGQQINLLMAGSVMSIVPLVIVFVIFQRQIISGIQIGAVKG